MVSLSLSEQDLFDLIMALHAAEDAAAREQDSGSTDRRRILLDKLHEAFEPLFAR